MVPSKPCITAAGRPKPNVTDVSYWPDHVVVRLDASADPTHWGEVCMNRRWLLDALRRMDDAAADRMADTDELDALNSPWAPPGAEQQPPPAG